MKHLFTVGTGLFLLLIYGSTVNLPAHAASGTIDGDVFGLQQGVFHPFLSVTERYTDNLYNSNTNKESELVSIVSPGLALALPGSDVVDIKMNTATGVPGGLAMSRYKMDTTRRYQGMLVYNPEFEFYHDNSSENFISQKVKGAFQYNAPGGLTLDIADHYKYGQEMRGEIGNPDPDTYYANVAHAIVEFAFSPKFSIGAGGAFHTISYRETDFRDRNDRVYFSSLNFHPTTKTRLFFEYKNIDVRYDAFLSTDKENTEDQYYAGFAWKMTAKSQGTFKVGYMAKDFDTPGIDDPSDWAGEIDLTHAITPDTAIMLGASRKYHETNIAAADYYTADRVTAMYSQAFTSKLKGDMMLSYGKDNYEGIVLECDTYIIRPALTFKPRRWLSIELAYSYTERFADLAFMDYSTNDYTLRIGGTF